MWRIRGPRPLEGAYGEAELRRWGPALVSQCLEEGCAMLRDELLSVLAGSYIASGPRPLLEALARMVADGLGLPLCRGEPGCCGVHLYLPPPRDCSPVFVVGVPGNVLRRFRLKKLEVIDIGAGIYLLRGRHGRAYVRLTPSGAEAVEPPCPHGLMEELRELLGAEARIRDVVDVLAARLEGDRRAAREALESLARKGCVEVHGGKVLIPG